MTEKDVELSWGLYSVAMKQKHTAGRARQVGNIFEMYCADLRIFAQELARWVKDGHHLGLHPFLLADDYIDKKDKVAAVMMSAVIPDSPRSLLRRLSAMRELLGGSPFAFLQGAYKLKDYSQYADRLGASSATLQTWVDILSKCFAAPLGMLKSNIDFYVRMSGLPIRFQDSLSLALFWLYENILDSPKDEVPVPNSLAIRQLIKVWVPRYLLITREEAISLFHMEYPAMIWYAAMGRQWLYQNHYDEIWKMEHTLTYKLEHGTQAHHSSRKLFKKNYLLPLYRILEAYSGE